jgi:hypothetical protein
MSNQNELVTISIMISNPPQQTDSFCHIEAIVGDHTVGIPGFMRRQSMPGKVKGYQIDTGVFYQIFREIGGQDVMGFTIIKESMQAKNPT